MEELVQIAGRQTAFYTSEFYFRALVVQQTVMGYQMLIAASLLFLPWAFFRDVWRYGREREWLDAPSCIYMAFVPILSLIALGLLCSGIGHLMNPEFYAIHHILGILRQSAP